MVFSMKIACICCVVFVWCLLIIGKAKRALHYILFLPPTKRKAQLKQIIKNY